MYEDEFEELVISTPVSDDGCAYDHFTNIAVPNGTTILVKRFGDTISIAKKVPGCDKLEYLYQ